MRFYSLKRKEDTKASGTRVHTVNADAVGALKSADTQEARRPLLCWQPEGSGDVCRGQADAGAACSAGLCAACAHVGGRGVGARLFW